MKKSIRILNINKSSTAFSGVFEFDKKKYFFKRLIPSDLKRELTGYDLVKKYYPTSNLLLTDQSSGLLVFKYETSIGKDKGLLVDLIASHKRLPKAFMHIIRIYRKVFISTLKKTKATNSQIFFEKRVTKLRRYKESFKQANKIAITLNGHDLMLNPSAIAKEIEKYFKVSNKKWCVVAQADPSDLNIGSKPIFFDYTAGGFVPLMAEFATFYWYYLLQNNYLCLKYSKESFSEHKKILLKKDFVKHSGRKILHSVSPIRTEGINLYIEHVMKPTLAQIPDYKDWYTDFKNFLAMRILTVWDITKFSKKDQLLVLGYLEYFYMNFSPTSLNDLLMQ